MDDTKIVVTKLDAARRQLKTAIKLWFEDGDSVAIHTLIVAAYEIIDTLAGRKGVVDLLFAPEIVKDEYKLQWIRSVKSAANFFKHANRDPDGVLEFPLMGNAMFLFFSCSALQRMGETLGVEEAAMHCYFMLSDPGEILREDIKKNFSPDVFEQFNSLSKRDFLNQFSSSWKARDVKGMFIFDSSSIH
jgi:hypothetical protein